MRTLSSYTTELAREAGVEPAAAFVAFTDLEAFTEQAPAELPAEPNVLFVGVLERYKNVEGLAAAWRLVARRVPGAQLHLVGAGTLTEVAEGLAREGVEWERRLDETRLRESEESAIFDRELFYALQPRDRLESMINRFAIALASP